VRAAVVTDYTGRPLYLQIADELRRQIFEGDLAPGEQLPSIADLVAEYDTSTTTVRQALGVLRNEGLVFGHQGKGSFVRPVRPRRRRVLNHIYAERPTGSPLANSIVAAGGEPSWEHQSSTRRATNVIADRLRIKPGDPIMTTQYRFFSDAEPIMLSTSYEPLALTKGTPVELPEDGTAVGVVRRFDVIGINITHVTEDVTARAPRPYEVDALHVPLGVPVMSVERTYFADELPVETADVIVAADTYTLSYTVRIPQRAQ
jgi:DNA-binding GntR family transcriptional regulator